MRLSPEGRDESPALLLAGHKFKPYHGKRLQTTRRAQRRRPDMGQKSRIRRVSQPAL
jgi:hypothetical protein